MNLYYKRFAALVLALVVFAPDAQAQITQGNCQVTGSAVADLAVNNVRARLYNNGGLFWKGAGNVYNVPAVQPGQPLTPNAIFASGIWVGGLVNGQPRLAATDYGPWEFYPGPLNDAGGLVDPTCRKYDRIFVVNKTALRDYLADGTTTPDLRDWPVGLGAPAFVDANGNGSFDDGESEVTVTNVDQTLNLAAGQLPLFPGNGSADEMGFTVFNDVGGAHGSTGSAPIGIEIRQLAFAFNLGGAIGNTTFYRYEIDYKGSTPLTNAYFGVWSDPDLGNASDDYVGSDTTLGLGFVYNGDNNDEGSDGYGTAPPALGYDFFQGPLVDAPGQTHTDPDGTVYQDKKRLGTTVFLYYNNATGPNGNPRGNSTDWYNYLQGIWQDDNPMVDCGNGYGPSTGGTDPLACNADQKQTFFMWPGDPSTGEFWSEVNFDNAGNANTPSDRRFLISTGPFEFAPGATQELVYGIVWSKGDDNLSSVAKMKADDAVAQSAFDANFELAQPPLAPNVVITELDQQVVFSWSYDDPLYVQQYEEFNPFSFEELPDGSASDRTYNFEAFEVFRYPTVEFNQDDAQRVAVYDVVNGVSRIFEPNASNETVIVATFPDTEGLKYSFRATGLTNFTEYYYGIRAVAYNGDTEILKVLPSPVSRFIVMPSPEEISGQKVNIASFGTGLTGEGAPTNIGEGQFVAEVINPGELKDASYTAEFYEYTFDFVPPNGASESRTVVTYDLVRTAADGTVTKLVDGRAQARRTGQRLTQTADEQSLIFDGLSFKITGPDPDFTDFQVVANASGNLAQPSGASAEYRDFPGLGRTGLAAQQSTDGGQDHETFFMIGVGDINTSQTYSDFIARFTQYTGGFGNPDGGLAYAAPDDYEVRFTGNGKAWNYFTDEETVVSVPFELWNVGVAAQNDASDDYQLVPYILQADEGNDTFDLVADDHSMSGGANDPYTDLIYWVAPVDDTPGSQGYNNFIGAIESKLAAGAVPSSSCVGWADPAGGGVQVAAASLDPACDGISLFHRQVFINFNGATTGDAADGQFYNPVLPETGTVFRIITSKPNSAGDKLTFSTTEIAPAATTDSSLAVARGQIGIVPNPYKGASAYEVSNLSDVARFVNLPETATIRIFTLSGTLIRTLEKSGPARTLDWNLQTEAALPIASGMYLIHIELPDGEEKVIKFGVIKKRIQLDLL